VSEKEKAGDTAAFIAVFAALLLDNVLRLEETVDQVSKLVMGSGKPDRELVVTLQSFDRHKQEFEALGEALTRYAEAANDSSLSSEERAKLEEKVISAITVADLKDRLLSRLQGSENSEFVAPQISEQEAAQVGVDVIY
jgi:hypothetical protein